jgi:aminoglycoside phosphotransferase (APT) family kinase protein
VLESLEALHGTPPPPGLPPLTLDELHTWREVEADPAPFLSLGLCSRAWLKRALPALRQAAVEAPMHGDALVHLDVRSDNVCIRDGRALLVDWNWACVGNAELDLAAWLPSLHLEGGAPPEQMLADAGGFASWLAAVWCAAAPNPPPPGVAPSVRRLQANQGAVALRWAAGALGLPPPDGLRP